MRTASKSSREPVSFRDIVAERQRANRARTKGERTRGRIFLAAIDLLNEIGYREMKVSDVCKRAKVTPPVLYLYFKNKLALTTEVLQAFLDNFLAGPAAADRTTSRSAYEAIHAANRDWIKVARHNAGLVRCLLQLADDEPAFARLFADANDKWYRRISASVLHRSPGTRVREGDVRLAAYALGGMLDELVRKLFTARDPHLAALVAEVTPTDEEFARFVSLLWHRVLYASDPAEVTSPLAPLARAAAATPAPARRSRRRM